jgi:hypothetical protein
MEIMRLKRIERHWHRYGSILGSGFLRPAFVAVQSDGKILVAYFENNAVKRMNADGTAIVTLGLVLDHQAL